jgi:hypothetical protein
MAKKDADASEQFDEPDDLPWFTRRLDGHLSDAEAGHILEVTGDTVEWGTDVLRRCRAALKETPGTLPEELLAELRQFAAWMSEYNAAMAKVLIGLKRDA